MSTATNPRSALSIKRRNTMSFTGPRVFRIASRILMAKPENANTQHARFLETARALGCDEDEGAFDEKLKQVTRQKPSDPPKPTKED